MGTARRHRIAQHPRGERVMDVYSHLLAERVIYDTMQHIRPAIATTVIGQAIGPAALLAAAGAPGQRAALEHARIVLHQPAGQSRGAIPDLILAADEVVRVRSDLESTLARHTGRTVEALRADTDRDRVFTASAALEYGLIDTVLGERTAGE